MRPVPRTAAAGAARGRSEQLDVTTLSASAALAVPGPGLTASLSGRLTGPGSASDPWHDGCLGVRPHRAPSQSVPWPRRRDTASGAGLHCSLPAAGTEHRAGPASRLAGPLACCTGRPPRRAVPGLRSLSDPSHDGCLGRSFCAAAAPGSVSAVAAEHCQRRRAALQPACRWH